VSVLTWPSDEQYQRQAAIPEADRCGNCKGLGLVRWKFSSPGHTEHDYQTCWDCDGSGRKALGTESSICYTPDS
jgi:DnaJ-class molecular chaperone